MTLRNRVLIIVQNLPVPLDRRVWLECRALTEAGYQVRVICPKGPGDPDYQLLDGVHIYKYEPVAADSGVVSYLREFFVCWLRTARLARRVYREQGFDIIQACNPPDTYALLALLYRRRGVRFVYDQHDLCPEVYQSRFERPSRILLSGLYALEKITYRTAHHVISTNDSYRSIAMRRGGRSLEDTTVVRSGPDTDRMLPGQEYPELRKGRRFLLCYLGVMGPQDGVDNAIHALDELVNKRGRSDVHLALLGFGDCYDELRALATELNLDEYVTFTGRADHEMISQYLSTADVGVGPDPLNPLNNVSTMNKTMEYMAYGLPVVTFDLAETRVSAGEAAEYVPPGDVPAFADAIERLLEDPGRRAELSEWGRKRAVEILDWRLQVPGYVAVFDQLSGREGAAVWPADEVAALGAVPIASAERQPVDDQQVFAGDDPGHDGDQLTSAAG
ncbi:glycosyltransferase family 4 protein [Frankia sp. Cpl3]|nr:glycosyltransferase family 4 protein [Frankia sp. Cpl3]